MPITHDTHAMMEELLSAWVIAGTRFAPPDNKYDEYGFITKTSVERKQLSDEDVRSVVANFPGLLEIDLAGCERLTDASVSEIASCAQLRSLNVRCVGTRALCFAPSSLSPPLAGAATS